MGKFSSNKKKGLPAISTASLPDVVFMMLIFFMVSTQLREVELNIIVRTPDATEIKKLEKKQLVSYIYIGPPKRQYESKYGTAPRIQLNDAFADITDIRDFISIERDKLSESERAQMTVSLKIDQYTRMGVVTDVKQALRKAQALKINYSARKAKQTY